MKRRLAPREKILRAARRLLVEHGHEKVSLRALARRVGLAASSLYEHFADRQAILEALALAAFDDLRREIAEACLADVSSDERLANAAMAYLTFATTRQNEFLLCFSRTQPADRTAPPTSSPLEPVVSEISRALALGEYEAPPGFTALDMAIALWTQMHGIAVLRQAYLSQAPDFEEKARRMIEVAIAAWRRR